MSSFNLWTRGGRGGGGHASHNNERKKEKKKNEESMNVEDKTRRSGGKCSRAEETHIHPARKKDRSHRIQERTNEGSHDTALPPAASFSAVLASDWRLHLTMVSMKTRVSSTVFPGGTSTT